MKKRTKLIAASLSALVVISGIGIGASIPVRGVTKVNYQFIVNEKKLDLPSYLTIMSKDNATYVPIRFLSENMGLDVEYLPGTVRISSEEFKTTATDQTKDKIAKLESQVKELKMENDLLKKQIGTSNSMAIFRQIPTYAEDDGGFRTTINHFKKDTAKTSKMNITLTNNADKNYYYLDPFATELIVDGKTYNATEDTDIKLFSTLKPDDTISGAVVFDGLENVKVKGTLRLYYKLDNTDKKTMEIYFDNTK